MDGIDKLYYKGELIPEYADAGLTDRNWRFHAGTITTQVVPKDVTAIAGDTLTLQASHGFIVGDEVALTAGVDPEPSPYPTGVVQHHKLYVTFVSGNDVKLSLSSGGAALTWTSSPYLLTNLKVYKANAGFFDAIQGRPQFFQNIDFTFSGICYVEVNLPAGMGEADDQPTDFKIYVRGRRLQNYDASGQLADPSGVAYNPLALPAQTKFFSANNALVAVDIMLNFMNVEKTRIDWPSFVAYRDHCDEIIAWDSGTTEILANPSLTFTNAASPSLGGIVKSGGVDGAWDSGALSVESSNKNIIQVSGIYRGGHSAIGLTTATTPPVVFNAAGNLFSIHPSIVDGHLRFYEGTSSTPIYNQLTSFRDGDTFRIELNISENRVNFYQNDALLLTKAHGLGAVTVRGYVALYTSSASYTDFRYFPMDGGIRTINRFDAHIVFPSQVDTTVALQQAFGRSPDCHWQDVNGKIKFIVGGHYDTSGTPDAGERVVAGKLTYDPNQIAVKSNIVADSFSSYRTPPEDKANFMRLELRDIDDIYFTKKYSYTDRDNVRDQAGTLVDFGVIPVGVASQSLADRMGEAIMRWGSDLDLFVNVKGSPSTYAYAKGDIVKFSHDVADWDIPNEVDFIIIDETFESGGIDEKTYLLQAYNQDFYTDTDHGPITGNFPVVPSRLAAPPPPLDVRLLEESRALPDGTAYSVIKGTVVFDTSYPYAQRARIFWKRTSDVEYLPTGIVVEQGNSSVSELDFELNFASIGINAVKVTTENQSGIPSSSSEIEAIDITGAVQVELVEWEGFNANAALVGTTLAKVTGAAGWNAGARSTKELHHGYGYIQWNILTSGKTALGFSIYTNANLALDDLTMLYGLIIETGQQPLPVVSGSTGSAIGTATQVGFGYKIEIDDVNSLVRFYEVIGGEATQIYTTTLLNRYPIYVDASIYNSGDTIAQPQFYGRLEQTSGYKVHWNNIAGITINEETLTKVVGSDWASPNQGIAFGIEYLNGDGAVEFEVTEGGHYRGVGFSATDIDFLDPTLPGYKSIKYMWYMKGSLFGEPANTLSVIEGTGTAYNEYGGYTYATGDILRVERIGTTIYYRQNGILRYTSTIPSPVGEQLHPDVAMYDSTSTIKNIRLKKVGLFIPGVFPYPIYRASNLRVIESRPEDDGTVYTQLAGTFPVEEGAPIQRASVRVYDKFGNIVKSFPPFTYAGNGIIGQGHHPRKYADPTSEAIYEIQAVNDDTTSLSVFLQGNGTTFTSSLVMPALKNFTNAVKDLNASSIDHNKISLAWVYGSNAQVQYRIGTTGAWSTAITALTSPYIVTGLVPDTYYEFRAAPTGTTDNYSNIARSKTQPAPLTVEAAPPPLSLTGTLDAVNPESKLTLNWSRNSTTNTGVKIYQNGSLIYTGSTATEVTKQITGLSSATTYTFKVKNIYAGGDSEFSNEITITTGVVEGANRPSGLVATGVGHFRIDLSWVNHTSSGTVAIERSVDLTTWTTIDTVAATLNVYSDFVSPGEGYYYRVYNTGYSNTAYGATTVVSDGGGCVLTSTMVQKWHNGIIVNLRAGQIKPDDIMVGVGRDGRLKLTKVRKVHSGKASVINIITTSSGKELWCTLSHPIVVDYDHKVKKSLEISSGEPILVYDELLDVTRLEMVESKDRLEGDFDIVIYELDSEEHTFISNGIISHNISNKY